MKIICEDENEWRLFCYALIDILKNNFKLMRFTSIIFHLIFNFLSIFSPHLFFIFLQSNTFTFHLISHLFLLFLFYFISIHYNFHIHSKQTIKNIFLHAGITRSEYILHKLNKLEFFTKQTLKHMLATTIQVRST